MEELKLAWCIILFLLKNYNLCTHRPLPYFSLCGFLFFSPGFLCLFHLRSHSPFPSFKPAT